MNCCDVVRSDLGMVRSEMVSLELPEVAPGDVCTRVTSAAAGVGQGGNGELRRGCWGRGYVLPVCMACASYAGQA